MCGKDEGDGGQRQRRGRGIAKISVLESGNVSSKQTGDTRLAIAVGQNDTEDHPKISLRQAPVAFFLSNCTPSLTYLAMASTMGSPSQDSIDNKIMNDLKTVGEKMDIIEGLLRPGGGNPVPSVRRDATIMSLIGFLEACSPRMIQLVEAAAQGFVAEPVLVKCLEVNDRLTKVMADIDTVALTETPATTTVAAAPSPDVSDDLLFADSSTSVPVVGKSEDFFDNESFGEAPDPGIPTSKSDDDFDSFFSERSNAPS